MAQAFDDDGNPLGPEIFGNSMHEALDKVLEQHMDPAEVRVRKLRQSIPDEQKLDLIIDMLTSIEARLRALENPPTTKETQ